MAPTPQRSAHTSSEVKKLHKQNGPRLPERQLKQLARGHELAVRAARVREADERRRHARRKRAERDEKAQAARRQTGVGLATQLIGYSHTQAQLKRGMEAFLGVTTRNEDAQRRRDAELSKQLQAIAHVTDREPWDDDDDDDDDDSLPAEHYVDDDLDDDALLQAHDLAMSDPTCANPAPAHQDADFTRLHGPMKRSVEAGLEKLPEPVHDGWDDFLDSGTQIARELSADGPLAEPLQKNPIAITQPAAVETVPPLSTQDLDFSIDDLEESPPPIDVNQADMKSTMNTTRTAFVPKFPTPTAKPQNPAPVTHASAHALPSIRQHGAAKASLPVKSKRRPQQSVRVSSPFDMSTLRPSQRPPSVSDRPGFKRKAVTAPGRGSLSAPKRSCAESSRSTSGSSNLLGHSVVTALNDFGISTQDLNSFFADDDELYSGSPPIVV
ncbi:hypothetical protein BDU57DRAFT_538892 [Ampelomyces quisqualis]|uniref:Uncharacterized protein n=1 Tax=Ampelomyces quisqualis TaxID=50730 RepID=A0A6A5QRJ4_AMPQU|nr:hypothetical protein BDU57DRAFT_538892 [Ampelomyces quisqualis]